MNKGWLFVAMTCLFELIWVFGFKMASLCWHWPILISIIIVDFIFLFKACKYLPTGTVYAVFSAIGTIGATVIDVCLFDASLGLLKVFFIALLVLGVISLKMADSEEEGGTI